MSTERDELAAAIMEHPWLEEGRKLYAGICPSCPGHIIHGGHNSPSHAAHIAEALLAAGYRKPQQVTTAEELDALGFQSVVLDAYGTPYVCERHRTDKTRNEWKPSGMNHLDDSETILYHGPATVVHAPETP